MREAYKVDEQGFYIEPVLVQGNEVARGLIDVRIPEGFHKPKFNGTSWIEGITQAELDVINNMPKVKSESEQIAELQSIVDQLLLDSLMGV